MANETKNQEPLLSDPIREPKQSKSLQDLYSELGVSYDPGSEDQQDRIRSYGQSRYIDRQLDRDREKYGVKRDITTNYSDAIGQRQDWELALALGRIPMNVIGGIVEGVGYLGEIGGIGGGDYENWLTRAGQSIKNDYNVFSKVYARDSSKIIDWGDKAFWATNAAGLIESAASFATIGGGYGAILSKMGGFLAKANTLAKMGKMSSYGRAFKNTMVSMSLAYTEGAMTGAEVYNQIIKKEVKKGKTLIEAEAIARQGARSAVAMNTTINTAMNMIGLSAILGNTGRSARRIGNLSAKNSDEIKNVLDNLKTSTKKQGKAGVGVSEDLLTKTMKQLDNIEYGTNRQDKLRIAGGYLAESLGESAEELVNVASKATGLRMGEEENKDLDLFGNMFKSYGNFFSNFTKDVATEEGALSAGLGFLGGFMQANVIDKVWASQNQHVKRDEFGNVVYQKATEEEIQNENIPTVKIGEEIYLAGKDGEPLAEIDDSIDSFSFTKKGWFFKENKGKVVNFVNNSKSKKFSKEQELNIVLGAMRHDMTKMRDNLKIIEELEAKQEQADGSTNYALTPEEQKKLAGARSAIANLSNYKSINAGYGNYLKDIYLGLSEIDNENDLGQEFEQKKKELETQLNNDALEEEQKTILQTELKNVNEVLDKMSQRFGYKSNVKTDSDDYVKVTRAMLRGFAANAKDNSVKNLYKHAANKVDVLTRLYNEHDLGGNLKDAALYKMIFNATQEYMDAEYFANETNKELNEFFSESSKTNAMNEIAGKILNDIITKATNDGSIINKDLTPPTLDEIKTAMYKSFGLVAANIELDNQISQFEMHRDNAKEEKYKELIQKEIDNLKERNKEIKKQLELIKIKYNNFNKDNSLNIEDAIFSLASDVIENKENAGNLPEEMQTLFQLTGNYELHAAEANRQKKILEPYNKLKLISNKQNEIVKLWKELNDRLNDNLENLSAHGKALLALNEAFRKDALTSMLERQLENTAQIEDKIVLSRREFQSYLNFAQNSSFFNDKLSGVYDAILNKYKKEGISEEDFLKEVERVKREAIKEILLRVYGVDIDSIYIIDDVENFDSYTLVEEAEYEKHEKAYNKIRLKAIKEGFNLTAIRNKLTDVLDKLGFTVENYNEKNNLEGDEAYKKWEELSIGEIIDYAESNGEVFFSRMARAANDNKKFFKIREEVIPLTPKRDNETQENFDERKKAYDKQVKENKAAKKKVFSINYEDYFMEDVGEEPVQNEGETNEQFALREDEYLKKHENALQLAKTLANLLFESETIKQYYEQTKNEAEGAVPINFNILKIKTADTTTATATDTSEKNPKLIKLENKLAKVKEVKQKEIESIEEAKDSQETILEKVTYAISSFFKGSVFNYKRHIYEDVENAFDDKGDYIGDMETVEGKSRQELIDKINEERDAEIKQIEKEIDRIKSGKIETTDGSKGINAEINEEFESIQELVRSLQFKERDNEYYFRQEAQTEYTKRLDELDKKYDEKLADAKPEDKNDILKEKQKELKALNRDKINAFNTAKMKSYKFKKIKKSKELANLKIKKNRTKKEDKRIEKLEEELKFIEEVLIDLRRSFADPDYLRMGTYTVGFRSDEYLDVGYYGTESYTYEIKLDAVLFNGKEIPNPDNKSKRELINEHNNKIVKERFIKKRREKRREIFNNLVGKKVLLKFKNSEVQGILSRSETDDDLFYIEYEKGKKRSYRYNQIKDFEKINDVEIIKHYKDDIVVRIENIDYNVNIGDNYEVVSISPVNNPKVEIFNDSVAKSIEIERAKLEYDEYYNIAGDIIRELETTEPVINNLLDRVFDTKTTTNVASIVDKLLSGTLDSTEKVELETLLKDNKNIIDLIKYLNSINKNMLSEFANVKTDDQLESLLNVENIINNILKTLKKEHNITLKFDDKGNIRQIKDFSITKKIEEEVESESTETESIDKLEVNSLTGKELTDKIKKLNDDRANAKKLIKIGEKLYYKENEKSTPVEVFVVQIEGSKITITNSESEIREVVDVSTLVSNKSGAFRRDFDIIDAKYNAEIKALRQGLDVELAEEIGNIEKRRARSLSEKPWSLKNNEGNRYLKSTGKGRWIAPYYKNDKNGDILSFNNKQDLIDEINKLYDQEISEIKGIYADPTTARQLSFDFEEITPELESILLASMDRKKQFIEDFKAMLNKKVDQAYDGKSTNLKIYLNRVKENILKILDDVADTYSDTPFDEYYDALVKTKYFIGKAINIHSNMDNLVSLLRQIVPDGDKKSTKELMEAITGIINNRSDFGKRAVTTLNNKFVINDADNDISNALFNVANNFFDTVSNLLDNDEMIISIKTNNVDENGKPIVSKIPEDANKAANLLNTEILNLISIANILIKEKAKKKTNEKTKKENNEKTKKKTKKKAKKETKKETDEEFNEETNEETNEKLVKIEREVFAEFLNENRSTTDNYETIDLVSDLFNETISDNYEEDNLIIEYDKNNNVYYYSRSETVNTIRLGSDYRNNLSQTTHEVLHYLTVDGLNKIFTFDVYNKNRVNRNSDTADDKDVMNLAIETLYNYFDKNRNDNNELYKILTSNKEAYPYMFKDGKAISFDDVFNIIKSLRASNRSTNKKNKDQDAIAKDLDFVKTIVSEMISYSSSEKIYAQYKQTEFSLRGALKKIVNAILKFISAKTNIEDKDLDKTTVSEQIFNLVELLFNENKPRIDLKEEIAANRYNSLFTEDGNNKIDGEKLENIIISTYNSLNEEQKKDPKFYSFKELLKIYLDVENYVDSIMNLIENNKKIALNIISINKELSDNAGKYLKDEDKRKVLEILNISSKSTITNEADFEENSKIIGIHNDIDKPITELVEQTVNPDTTKEEKENALDLIINKLEAIFNRPDVESIINDKQFNNLLLQLKTTHYSKEHPNYKKYFITTLTNLINQLIDKRKFKKNGLDYDVEGFVDFAVKLISELNNANYAVMKDVKPVFIKKIKDTLMEINDRRGDNDEILAIQDLKGDDVKGRIISPKYTVISNKKRFENVYNRPLIILDSLSIPNSSEEDYNNFTQGDSNLPSWSELGGPSNNVNNENRKPVASRIFKTTTFDGTIVYLYDTEIFDFIRIGQMRITDNNAYDSEGRRILYKRSGLYIEAPETVKVVLINNGKVIRDESTLTDAQKERLKEEQAKFKITENVDLSRRNISNMSHSILSAIVNSKDYKSKIKFTLRKSNLISFFKELGSTNILETKTITETDLNSKIIPLNAEQRNKLDKGEAVIVKTTYLSEKPVIDVKYNNFLYEGMFLLEDLNALFKIQKLENGTYSIEQMHPGILYERYLNQKNIQEEANKNKDKYNNEINKLDKNLRSIKSELAKENRNSQQTSKKEQRIEKIKKLNEQIAEKIEKRNKERDISIEAKENIKNILKEFKNLYYSTTTGIKIDGTEKETIHALKEIGEDYLLRQAILNELLANPEKEMSMKEMETVSEFFGTSGSLFDPTVVDGFPVDKPVFYDMTPEIYDKIAESNAEQINKAIMQYQLENGLPVVNPGFTKFFDFYRKDSVRNIEKKETKDQKVLDAQKLINEVLTYNIPNDMNYYIGMVTGTGEVIYKKARLKTPNEKLLKEIVDVVSEDFKTAAQRFNEDSDLSLFNQFFDKINKTKIVKTKTKETQYIGLNFFKNFDGITVRGEIKASSYKDKNTGIHKSKGISLILTFKINNQSISVYMKEKISLEDVIKKIKNNPNDPNILYDVIKSLYENNFKKEKKDLEKSFDKIKSKISQTKFEAIIQGLIEASTVKDKNEKQSFSFDKILSNNIIQLPARGINNKLSLDWIKNNLMTIYNEDMQLFINRSMMLMANRNLTENKRKDLEESVNKNRITKNTTSNENEKNNDADVTNNEEIIEDLSKKFPTQNEINESSTSKNTGRRKRKSLTKLAKKPTQKPSQKNETNSDDLDQKRKKNLISITNITVKENLTPELKSLSKIVDFSTKENAKKLYNVYLSLINKENRNDNENKFIESMNSILESCR